MSDSKQPPQPVEGVVYGRSMVKTFAFIVLNILVFLFGVFLIWAKVTDQVLDRGPNPKQVTWWGLLIGICAVLVGPVMVVLLLRSLWVHRRLVVGEDRLQMLEHLGGEDVVILQIPFDNMAEVKFEATETERRVGINLCRLDDPNTYAKKENFAANGQSQGWHLCVTGGYTAGVRAIATAIEQARARWVKRHPPNQPHGERA